MTEALNTTPTEQEPPEQPQNPERNEIMSYDPNHEINVALRAIQEETMRKIAAEFGPEAAKRFETTEGWSGWPEVLASDDIVGTFRKKYDIFVAERLAELEEENAASKFDQAA